MRLLSILKNDFEILNTKIIHFLLFTISFISTVCIILNSNTVFNQAFVAGILFILLIIINLVLIIVRNKISIKLKSIGLFILLFAFLNLSVLYPPLFSDVKILLLFIPISSAFIFSKRTFLLILIVTLIDLILLTLIVMYLNNNWFNLNTAFTLIVQNGLLLLGSVIVSLLVFYYKTTISKLIIPQSEINFPDTCDSLQFDLNGKLLYISLSLQQKLQLTRIPEFINSVFTNYSELEFFISELGKDKDEFTCLLTVYEKTKSQIFRIIFKKNLENSNTCYTGIFVSNDIFNSQSDKFKNMSESETNSALVPDSKTAFLNTALSITPSITIFRTNLSGIITFWNNTAEQIFGIHKEEATGKNLFKLLADYDEFIKFYQNCNNLSVDFNLFGPLEIEFTNKYGNTITLQSTIILFNENDVLCISTDITELKYVEKLLRISEERFKILLDTFPDIIILTGINGQIIFGNKAMEEQLGIQKSEYKNLDRSAHIHPDDAIAVNLNITDLINNPDKKFINLEFRYINAWEITNWYNGIITINNFRNVKYIQYVLRNINDKKQADLELESYRNNLEVLVNDRTDALIATNEELNATNEELYNQRTQLENTLNSLRETHDLLIRNEKMASLGVLVSGIAHELNNPLNFIQAGLYGIEDIISENKHITLISDDLPFLIDGIKSGIIRISDIVNKLALYSNKEIEINSVVNIHKIIESVVIHFQNNKQAGIEIKTDCLAANCMINGSESKLHKVIFNLLNNAIQAISSKGLIRIYTFNSNQFITIKITDTGSGINKNIISRIFDPFFTTKSPGNGMGLGLSIAYEIIKEHNGTITVTSEEFIGTEINIKFPIKE